LDGGAPKITREHAPAPPTSNLLNGDVGCLANSRLAPHRCSYTDHNPKSCLGWGQKPGIDGSPPASPHVGVEHLAGDVDLCTTRPIALLYTPELAFLPALIHGRLELSYLHDPRPWGCRATDLECLVSELLVVVVELLAAGVELCAPTRDPTLVKSGRSVVLGSHGAA